MNYVEKESIKLILLADILLKFLISRYTNMQREKERRKNLE